MLLRDAIKKNVCGCMAVGNDTQEKLSKAIGLSSATFSRRLENAESFTILELSRIAQRYNVKLEDLLKKG